MKIYTSGLIAYETAKKLYEKDQAALERRFPQFFLRDFLELSGSPAERSRANEPAFMAEMQVETENLSEESQKEATFLDNLCIEKNTKKDYIKKNIFPQSQSGLYIKEITEGGLFAALWEACEVLSLQEPADKKSKAKKKSYKRTIGCRVSIEKIPIEQHVVEILEYFKESPYEVSSKGSWLIVSSLPPEELQKRLNAACLTEIGEITDSKERVVLQGETKRFLSPPARQQKDIEDRKNNTAGLKEYQKLESKDFPNPASE